MFVNGLSLFVTESRKIGLLTVEFLPSQTADSLHNYLTKVVRFYKRTGFLVKMCLMDMEFEVLESKSENALFNCTAAREHVGDIERSIRTIREREQDVMSASYNLSTACLMQWLYSLSTM
ncbi:hypothetical protein ACHAXN_002482 [Cyclotella atomus]